MKASSFKSKIKSGERVYGSWVTLAHPSIPEIMGRAGFDFLVVDMEHSAIDLGDAQRLFQAIEAQGITPIVRIGEHDPNLIKRVMDAGATGVIAAMVTTADEAQLIVDSVKYPPMGKRGVGYGRAQRYGMAFKEYRDWLPKESVVMALIEHYHAIENLEAILETPGIDGSLIGPYDLSASFGYPGEFDRPEVKKAIEKYEKVCKKLKKPMGFHIVHPDPAIIQKRLKAGYKIIALGLDALLLGEKCQEVIQLAKKK